jgi:hypothetical protein
MRRTLFLVAAAAAIIGGCARTREPPPARCDYAVGSATAPGRGLAQQRALRDLSRQIPDTRGDLIGLGISRLRGTRPHLACRPYSVLSLPTGLTSCTASVRICGR